MKNPWTKKNPFLSMWLSGANAVAGAARSRATAEARRQTALMMAQGSRQMAELWGEAVGVPRKKRRKKAR
ncbi:hypothetical protein [Janthinobacterium sp. 17J80-10]|uniref:hypothetical protein n=1 Tax=Janthinobacterium sp. 17J80-10 TaxID=2497863 RepID=UPI0010058178|nr:hypothetical protein [Janthinobacterium sp. 17J80-10]QAU35184.1 hypothetical protein EKL02_13920 [Janthinobacterium sp. 17J80-10]